MRKKILHEAYMKGLYSQGTPDSWDEEALYQFGKHLIDECILAVEHSQLTFVKTTYDQDIAMTAKAVAIASIQNKFKDENIQ